MTAMYRPLLLSFCGLASIKVVYTLCSSPPRNRIVWFRPHALRTQDNEALRLALEEDSSSNLRFVFLWESDIAHGGTASDVFLVHALDSLNATLKGRLEVIDCTTSKPFCGGEGARLAQALLNCAEDWFPNEDIANTEVFYLETYNHQLEEDIFGRLTTHEGNLHPRPIKGCQTLLEYGTSNDNPELDPAELVRQAIEKHPFASPLIPFVDHVVGYMEKNPTPKVKTVDVEELLPLEQSQPFKETPTTVTNLSIQELLEQVGTTRATNWGTSIAKQWPASEEAALQALQQFVDSQYPSLVGSKGNVGDQRQTHLASHLSPYIARGVVSPKQIYHALGAKNRDQQNSFLRRIAWRDYAYAVSCVFPKQPIRTGYHEGNDDNLHKDENMLLTKWKRGQTGFPLVDAGMRQLIPEGFMPQQVRLAVSACLVEGLNVSWKLGMKHFEEFLVDYDEVINGHMWMNAGGVGLDPYYIGLDYKKRPYWDAAGAYVRKWCPELRRLPDRIQVPPTVPGTGGTNTVDALYTPWKAPNDVLEEAGVVIGQTYPHRICDERRGRRSFLEGLRHSRSAWAAIMIDASGNDIIEIGGERIGAFTPRCIKA